MTYTPLIGHLNPTRTGFRRSSRRVCVAFVLVIGAFRLFAPKSPDRGEEKGITVMVKTPDWSCPNENAEGGTVKDPRPMEKSVFMLSLHVEAT